ncbi:MAG TPA: hypothetical protein VIM41_11940 [Gammaproteobacteria bacterium]
MNSKMAKLISPERVVELLECYGANPEAWPDDERTTALALIQHSTELQNLQREAGQLDKFLTNAGMQEPADLELVSRIVNNLPVQDKAKNSGKRHGSTVAKRSLFEFSGWTGMLAASVAVFVITLSITDLHQSSSLQPQSIESQAELDYWMWQQVTGEADNDDDEEPATVLALFGLE